MLTPILATTGESRKTTYNKELLGGSIFLPTPNQESSDDYFGGRLPPTPKQEICAAQIQAPTPANSQKKPQGVPDLPNDSQRPPPKKDEEKKE
jgi:hypothetical protein